jgi:hypothetical protein
MGKPTNLKGAIGGYTKWGGRKYGILANQNDLCHEDWYCQICGEKQPAIISPCRVKYFEDFWLRVCAFCFVEDKIKSIVGDIEKEFES